MMMTEGLTTAQHAGVKHEVPLHWLRKKTTRNLDRRTSAAVDHVSGDSVDGGFYLSPMLGGCLLEAPGPWYHSRLASVPRQYLPCQRILWVVQQLVLYFGIRHALAERDSFQRQNAAYSRIDTVMLENLYPTRCEVGIWRGANFLAWVQGFSEIEQSQLETWNRNFLKKRTLLNSLTLGDPYSTRDEGACDVMRLVSDEERCYRLV